MPARKLAYSLATHSHSSEVLDNVLLPEAVLDVGAH